MGCSITERHLETSEVRNLGDTHSLEQEHTTTNTELEFAEQEVATKNH